MNQKNTLIINGKKPAEECFAIFSFLAESTDDYLVLWNLEEGKIQIAGGFEEEYKLEGCSDGGIDLEEYMQIVYERDSAAVYHDFVQIAAGKKEIHQMEYRLVNKDGVIVWISANGKLIRAKDGKPQYVIGRLSESSMAETADTLTGLMGIAMMMKNLEASLKQGENGSFMVLGIDNFKNINARYGRGYGNSILREIAQLLEELISDEFFVYRLDGDCFAVNLVGYDSDMVRDVYERLCSRMMEYCTVSASVVVYPIMEKSWDANQVFLCAEKTLEKAKKEGKNQLMFFALKDYEKQLYEEVLEEEMHRSIRNGFHGFSLVFQPQVSVRDYRVRGAEALLRFQSSVYGAVSPEIFIDILERNGDIIPVGRWVMEEAIYMCKRWRNKIPDFHVSINLSYVQFKQKNFSDDIYSLLDETDLPGNAIVLELTESMQLSDYHRFNMLFQQWRRRGIQIAIDDFGTGYSNLNYMKSLSVDEIKIDRSFVQNIHRIEYNYRFLYNILELAHSVHIRVCCEGVESFEELQILEQMEPEIIQGFYFRKPIRADEFEKEYIMSSVYHENWKQIFAQNKNTDVRSENKNGNLKVEAREEEKDNVFMSPRIGEEGILKDVRLGLWWIEIDTNTGRNRMYVDRNMSEILGNPGKLNSEEYYNHWYQNIGDGYYDYVNGAVEEMKTSGKIVQLEYTWTHPERGKVPVRCVGRMMKNENGVCILKGYHRIINDMIVKRYMDQTTEMFEYNESTRLIYFHSNRKMLWGEERKESGFPDSWIDRQVIHPHFAKKFRELFQKVKDMQEDVQMDVLIRNKEEKYDWFRLEAQRIGNLMKDRNTLIVSLHPIMREQNMQLKYIRKDDFYQAMLSETVAYIEVDMETELIQRSGGLWGEYARESTEKNFSFQLIMNRYLREYVKPEYYDEYYRIMNLEQIRKFYLEGKKTIKYQFKRKVRNGNYRWMELVIHAFQEQVTEKMYALLYLKDIDEVKKRHLRQEKAASVDVLTNLMNRRTFEKSVRWYMENDAKRNETSALLIFDIDNFKRVNDTKGHQMGDVILKKFTKILTEFFRKTDYIGRIGGDEFVVFVKNYGSKDILNLRLERMQKRLIEQEPVSISSSIGICLVDRETFDYKKNMRHADQALYGSKGRGRNLYTYWEDM